MSLIGVNPQFLQEEYLLITKIWSFAAELLWQYGTDETSDNVIKTHCFVSYQQFPVVIYTDTGLIDPIV